MEKRGKNMDFPNSFIAAAHALMDEEIAGRANELSSFCESPIELIFAVAFSVACSRSYAKVRYIEPGYDEAVMGPILTGKHIVVLEIQKPIDKYRVDFLVTYDRPAGPLSVIVECDGHDFHERTKEQAAHDRARDRELQADGRRVFRFTGSELYRKAFDCADEVIQALWDMNYANSTRKGV